MVVIVVDLSNPSEVLPSFEKWMSLLKTRLAKTYERLEQRGSKLPDQLRLRAKKALYGSNEDKDVVYHSGISIVIAATKYDHFMSHDPEMCKVDYTLMLYLSSPAIQIIVTWSEMYPGVLLVGNMRGIFVS